MGWLVAPSLNILLAEVNYRWRSRPTASDGSIGNAAHAARTSDHNPWVVLNGQAYVTARDFTNADMDGDEGAWYDDIAEIISEHLRATRDDRVKYVIWRARMFSSYATASTPAWQWRPYTGPNLHYKHCHVSVVADARLLDTRSWGLADATVGSRLPNIPIDPPEDDMPYTPDDIRNLVNEALVSSGVVENAAEARRVAGEALKAAQEAGYAAGQARDLGFEIRRAANGANENAAEARRMAGVLIEKGEKA